MRLPHRWILFLFVLALGPWMGACEKADTGEALPLEVPRGHLATLEISQDGRILHFGPFVGYYFKPVDPEDLTRLTFVCFNERRFYTRDLPENARLFTGEAVLTELPDVGRSLPQDARINPVFFSEAPREWVETRPEPKDLFLHFHSCYNKAGAVRTGYWVRHEGAAAFTYDMGGRVTEESPLHHEVTPGPDKAFARVIEFDRGPEK